MPHPARHLGNRVNLRRGHVRHLALAPGGEDFEDQLPRSAGLPDGSLVLIDCAAKLVHKAGVYAFALDGNAYVKRLIPSIDGAKRTPVAITMVSDSPAYAPVPLIGHRMNALRIVGRVRAVLADH